MRRGPDYRGIAGLILAVCAGAAFLLSMVSVSFYQDTAISPNGAALLNTLGGVIVGIVGSWITAGRWHHPDERPDEPPKDVAESSPGAARKTEGSTTMSDRSNEPRDPITTGDVPEREPQPEPEPNPDEAPSPDPEVQPRTEGDEADGQPVTRR